MSTPWWETTSTFHERKDGKFTEARVLADGSVRELRSAMGRTEEEVTCPFCGDETHCYRWSRWGSGKRCETCRAVLGGWVATRVVSERPAG